MTDPSEPRASKRKVPPDLQMPVKVKPTKIPKNTGRPVDLNEEVVRWLIISTCLHSILSPLLRPYVDRIVSSLYSSLVKSHSIDTQGFKGHLKKHPRRHKNFLQYESINSNWDSNKRYQNYDYKVTSHVDFSKLFLQPYMARYSTIDEACDLSALLGMVSNISDFPKAAQIDARKIQNDIRNPCAHCNYREWNAAKYTDSFDLMGQFVKHLQLKSEEEDIILEKLNKWETNGQNLLCGSKPDIEIVKEISQQTVLSEYVSTLTEVQRLQLQTELQKIETYLQYYEDRLIIVENKTQEHAEKFQKQEEEENNRIVQCISEWEQDQTTFLETRATRHILRSLPLHNCIVVTGPSGCGRSANIHHAALHLRDNFGYEIIPVLNGPTDIINHKSIENEKKVFVVDDICDGETISLQTLKMWSNKSAEMEKIFKDVTSKNDSTISKMLCPKLLISCSSQVYKKKRFQRIKMFTNIECNLVSPELCLNPDERKRMLQKYLPRVKDDVIEDITKDTQVMENVYDFPLLCKFSKDKTPAEVKKLITDSLNTFKSNMKNIINDNCYKYQCCALALCVLFDGEFNTDWLKLRSTPECEVDKLKDIVEEFDINLSKERHRNSLKSGFSALKDIYFKLGSTDYSMIHPTIYKMAAVICGQSISECFIKYAPSFIIQNHFIFESLTEVNLNGDSIILLEDQEEAYFQRLLRDLKEDFMTSTFLNCQLTDKTFREKLINFFKRRDDAKAVLKKLDTEGCIITYGPVELIQLLVHMGDFTTPLMESVIRGYVDIVHFLIIDTKCDVNKTDMENMSPLYLASANGHLDVVQLLIEHDADVSLCTNDGESPLYVACEGGHTDIVELLLRKGADVSKCDICGRPPLYVACEGGHKDIVELLLKKNADIFKIDDLESSPFHGACKGGNKDIVELFLQMHADVSQCMEDGQSPLYVASRAGQTDVVELLLQNKADVLQCDFNRNSPLHMACEGGHTNTVKLLLRNKADVSQCNNNAESPLYAACEGGRTDTINQLLQKGADILKCNADEESPLHVASKKGRTSTVELLLKNDADVNHCDKNRKSPLYVACEGGHTDIVGMLLQKCADVNHVDKNSKSPLFVACEGGHTDIVGLLLKNHANVNQSNDRGVSPLFVACNGRFRDTIELLLQNKADVSE